MLSIASYELARTIHAERTERFRRPTGRPRGAGWTRWARRRAVGTP